MPGREADHSHLLPKSRIVEYYLHSTISGAKFIKYRENFYTDNFSLYSMHRYTKRKTVKRKKCLSGSLSIIFGRSGVQISARILATLTEMFLVLLRPDIQPPGEYLKSGQDHFFPHPSKSTLQ
jgi:hypothetical protein